MLICPKLYKARSWDLGSNVLTPPFIYNKKDFSFHYENKENFDYWMDYYKKFNYPFMGGGYNFYTAHPIILNIYIPGQPISVGTSSLSSAYTAGSAGAAVGNNFWKSVNSALSQVYFYISSYTGTASLVTTINISVRNFNETTNLPDTTAPGLLETVVKDPASATGWINVTGFTSNSTIYNRFSVIVADADGNGTNFAILRAAITFPDQLVEQARHMASSVLLTSGGFASSNTYNANTPACVLVFADGSVQGNAITDNANHSSNSVERGIYLGDVPFSFKLFAATHGSSISNTQDIKLYDSVTLPGGTTIATGSNYFAANSLTVKSGCAFSSPFPELEVGNAYRVVFDPGGNSTAPIRLQFGTGNDANLRKARPGYGSWYYTDEAAGPVWTDTQEELPSMALIVEDFVAGASSVTLPSSGRIFPLPPASSY